MCAGGAEHLTRTGGGSRERQSVPPPELARRETPAEPSVARPCSPGHPRPWVRLRTFSGALLGHLSSLPTSWSPVSRGTGGTRAGGGGDSRPSQPSVGQAEDSRCPGKPLADDGLGGRPEQAPLWAQLGVSAARNGPSSPTPCPTPAGGPPGAQRPSEVARTRARRQLEFPGPMAGSRSAWSQPGCWA